MVRGHHAWMEEREDAVRAGAIGALTLTPCANRRASMSRNLCGHAAWLCRHSRVLVRLRVRS